jgi:hypothetical protein
MWYAAIERVADQILWDRDFALYDKYDGEKNTLVVPERFRPNHIDEQICP